MTGFFKDLAVAMTEKVRSIVQTEIVKGLATGFGTAQQSVQSSNREVVSKERFVTPNEISLSFIFFVGVFILICPVELLTVGPDLPLAVETSLVKLVCNVEEGISMIPYRIKFIGLCLWTSRWYPTKQQQL